MLNILFHKSTEITTEIKQFLMLLDNVRKKGPAHSKFCAQKETND